MFGLSPLKILNSVNGLKKSHTTQATEKILMTSESEF